MPIYIVTRCQRRRGDSARKFGGPDRYMAVVAVPNDVPFDPQNTPLHRQRLQRKGCQIFDCGEFYSKHISSRSRKFCQAKEEAMRILQVIQQAIQQQQEMLHDKRASLR